MADVNPLTSAVNPMAAIPGLVQQHAAAEATADKEMTAARTKANAIEDSSWEGYQKSSKEFDDRFTQLQKESQDLSQDTYRPPTPEDPLKSYGATISGLMGIASLFSHGSMVSAMNAGAAAINATRQKNSEEYDRQYDEWKTHNAMMQKKLAWESDAWGKVFDKAQTDMATAKGMATAILARTQDAAMRLAWAKDDIGTAIQIQNARTNMAREADEHAQKIQTQADKSAKVTAAQQKIKDEAGRYKGALELGNSLIAQVDQAEKSGDAITGVRGALNRGLESVMGQLSSDSGAEPDQTARNFSSDLDNYRQQAKLLVLGSKYMSKSAHDQLDELIKGDNYWDTPADVRKTVANIQSVIQGEANELPNNVYKEEGIGDIAPTSSQKKYSAGDVITRNGKQYRVTGNDPDNLDVEEIKQ